MFEIEWAGTIQDGEIHRVQVSAVKTTNPLKHEYPHAKLVNIKLTSIARLSRNVNYSNHLTK